MNSLKKCASYKGGGQREGFTLVELTVVILTLALVGVVLLPALAASGDNARRAVCFNNLKQLGAAAAMYPSENRDYMAQPNWDGGQSGTPAGWLYTTTNNTIPDPGPGGAYESKPLAAYATGLWFQYLRDPKTYLCPVDIQSQTYTATGNSHRLDRLSSYVMNGSVCGFQTAARTCKVTDIWSPSCWLLWGPNENAAGLGNPGAFAFNDGSMFPSTSEGLVEQLHTLAGGQVLTVGGSVQFVSAQKSRSESAAGVKNLAWWNPLTSSGH